MTRTTHQVLVKVKVKVKCALVQTLRLCTGRAAHRGIIGIGLPYQVIVSEQQTSSNVAVRPRWRKVVAVPEAAVTVLCTPDDGCNGHPKHVE